MHCWDPRLEASRILQNGTNEEEKEEGRRVLDFLAHTSCEGGYDCIPMHGADRDKPESKEIAKRTWKMIYGMQNVTRDCIQL